MEWKTYKPCLDTLVSVATVVTLVVAVVQYYDVRQEARVQAGLGYVQRFHSTPMVEAMADLVAAYSGREAQTMLESANPDDAPAWARASREFNRSRKLTRQTEIVANYFDDLYFCAAHELCDMDIAVVLVGSQARSIYIMSKSYLDEVNAKFGGTQGCGLAALARMQRRPELIAGMAPVSRSLHLDTSAC